MKNKYFLTGIISSALFLFLSHLYLYNYFEEIGEINVNKIIHKQINSEEKILFLSGINQSIQDYKFHSLSILNPKIVAVGSSRAMQVRKDFFKEEFYNLGGTSSTINSLIFTLNYILDKKSIETVLIFLDPWWFNHSYSIDGGSNKYIYFPNNYNLTMLYYLYKYNNSKFSNNLGLMSRINDSGFAKDGSYYYNGLINNTSSSDFKFLNTKKEILNNENRFKTYKFQSKYFIDKLCRTLINLKNNNKKVLILTTPFPSEIQENIISIYEDYIKKSYSEVANCTSDLEFYDFTLKHFDNCEFIDGIHGGETVYARMLLSISGHENIFNKSYLSKVIHHGKGKIVGIKNIYNDTFIERDFLGFGCDK